jgi:hypothetical protein
MSLYRVIRHVRCATCNYRTDRRAREEGGYGNCPKCNARMALGNLIEDRRYEKARRELKELGV